MKIKKDEWMWFDTENKWTMKIEEEKNNYYSDIYSPGQTKGRLKLGREVEWSTWWVKVLYFSYPAWSSLWVTNFTWFWFKPSSYIVQAWYASTWSALAMSYASYINWWVQWYLTYSWTYAQMTSRMLAVYDWANNTRANHSALLSDWIALDFINNSVDVKFTITAYE